MTQAFNLSQFANKVNTSGQANLTTAVTGTLPVANGGTGVTTTPANGQIPIGNGTNYVAANLTAGTGITITNSSGGVTIATASASSYAGPNTVIISTVGTTSWTVPSGITSCLVTVVGGGAANGGPNAGNTGGVAVASVTGLTPGATISVTVGAGSSAGANEYYTGGSSSFGSYVSAPSGNSGGGTVSGATDFGATGYQAMPTWLWSNKSIGYSPNNAAGSSPKQWSINSGFIPGARGAGANFYGGGSAGTSGVVVIQY